MPQSVSLLQVLLTQRGLVRRAAFAVAYEDTAREIDRSLIGTAPSRETFTRWLTAKVKTLPLDHHCRVLERMLPGYSVKALLSPYDPALGGSPQHTIPDSSEAATDRRDVLRLGIIAASGLTETFWKGPDLLERALDSGTIGEGRLQRLERETDVLGQRVVKVIPSMVLQETLLHLASVRELIEERQPIAIQRRLARIGAKLATVMGEISFNSDQFPLARRWYTAAARAAHEAGDTYLADIALAGATYLPTYRDDPRAVLALVLPRLTQSPSATPAIAWLWGFAAKAYAALGNQRAFEAAIEASRRALEQSSPDTIHPGIFSFLPEKLSFYEARGRSDLSDVAGAARAAEDALQRYDLTDTTEPALVRLERAAVLARSGESDEAYHLAVGAVTGVHTFLSFSVVTRAREFGRMLTPGSRVADDWRDLLVELRTPPAMTALPPGSGT